MDSQTSAYQKVPNRCRLPIEIFAYEKVFSSCCLWDARTVFDHSPIASTMVQEIGYRRQGYQWYVLCGIVSRLWMFLIGQLITKNLLFCRDNKLGLFATITGTWWIWTASDFVMCRQIRSLQAYIRRNGKDSFFGVRSLYRWRRIASCWIQLRERRVWTKYGINKSLVFVGYKDYD